MPFTDIIILFGRLVNMFSVRCTHKSQRGEQLTGKMLHIQSVSI